MKLGVTVLVSLLVCFSATANAGTVLFSDGGLSASAEWKLDTDDDTLTIVIENLTEGTESAGDLLTGFGFELSSGANPVLDEADGDAIGVDSDGDVTDLGSVDLLDIDGKTTWSLHSASGAFELQFNPDAAYAIIGPAESDGTYSTANGSIKGNKGHNPFVDGIATFVLSVEGDPELSNPYFLFGTDFGTRLVPLPPAALMGLLLLGGLGLTRRRLRRRNR